MRRTFLDLVTDDIGVGGVPVLYTLNGKLVYDLSPTDRIWLVNVSGRDTIRLGLAPVYTTFTVGDHRQPTDLVGSEELQAAVAPEQLGLGHAPTMGSAAVGA